MKLVATDTPQFIPGIGELGHARRQFSARNTHFPFPACMHVRPTAPSIQRMLESPRISCAYVPKGIVLNPLNQQKQPLAMTSPTWARGLSCVLRESACPRGAEIEGLSSRFCASRPRPLCANTPKSKTPAFLQNLVKWLPTRARVGEIRFFDHPYNPRMQEQFSASGGKVVKLGLANMPKASTTRFPVLTRFRGQWTDAGRSAYRSSSETFASPRPPSTCAKTPKYGNPSFPKNLVKGVQHARARVLNLDFSTIPYTSRMRKQYSTSRGKAVKLGPTNMLQVGTTCLSALPCVQGEQADAGRSAHSLSVDWQAWGTKGGLCWRATRDGLRHVPAGPPKLRSRKNPSKPVARDARKSRFPARTATISAEYLSQGIRPKTARETALANRNPLLRRAPSAGAGKNAHFPSRSFFARGVLGVAVGVGFGATDSHALVTRGNQSINSDCQIARGVSKVCSTR